MKPLTQTDKLILSTLIIILVGITGCVVWPMFQGKQPTNTNTVVSQNENSNTANTNISNINTVTQSNVCKDPARLSDIGGSVYPVSQKYAHTGWIGQVFTADDCGLRRLEEIFGGLDGKYGWGSTLWLKSNPSSGLLRVLMGLGYTCKDQNANSNQCQEWSLAKEIIIRDLLKLKPFVEEMKDDDCVLCG